MKASITEAQADLLRGMSNATNKAILAELRRVFGMSDAQAAKVLVVWIREAHG